jgi:hypothetical protein
MSDVVLPYVWQAPLVRPQVALRIDMRGTFSTRARLDRWGAVSMPSADLPAGARCPVNVRSNHLRLSVVVWLTS